MKYIIRDWASNICFHGRTFDTFEDAWSFIYEADPIPEPVEANEVHWYDDYYVEVQQ